MKIIGCLGIFLILLVASGAGYQYFATRKDNAKYPPPGILVDVGGYKLHINSMGIGQVTVILEAGSGSNSLEWFLVQPEIAKFTRVCSYDRAGLGWSEESFFPRTSQQMVEELHTLLQNAKIPKPYILVGHSLGGINVRLFAHQYPDEVAGIVLVDSSHEDQESRCPPNPMEKTFFAKHERLGTLCTALGFTRLIMKAPQTTPLLKLEPYPESVRQVFISRLSTTSCTRTAYQENLNFTKSLEQFKTAHFSFGSKQLTVISAGQPGIAEAYGVSQDWLNQTHEIWNILQKELVTQSSNSIQIIAEKSDHLITRYQPDLIVEAVRDMLGKATPASL